MEPNWKRIKQIFNMKQMNKTDIKQLFGHNAADENVQWKAEEPSREVLNHKRDEQMDKTYIP